MDKKMKELIAIGASVAAHCQPCLDWHLEQARGLGATEDEIETATKVGFMVEDGAGKAMREYALKSKSEPAKSGSKGLRQGGGPFAERQFDRKGAQIEEALVFPTTHHMLTSEALLKREGFELRLVPAPPGAGQVCVRWLSLSSADTTRAVELLEGEGVPIAAVLPYQGCRNTAPAGSREIPGGGKPLSGAAGERSKVAGRGLVLKTSPGYWRWRMHAEKVLRVVAGRTGSFISNKRATGMVWNQRREIRPFGPWGELVAWMREAGHVHLLLDLGTSTWDCMGTGIVQKNNERQHHPHRLCRTLSPGRGQARR